MFFHKIISKLGKNLSESATFSVAANQQARHKHSLEAFETSALIGQLLLGWLPNALTNTI